MLYEVITPCPTCFFCIDSHIHGWYADWAQAFDACAVSLKDHMPAFRQRLPMERVVWLPPFAKDTDQPPASPPEPEFDLLFVGTVDPETTPGRVRFLDEVKARMHGREVRKGEYRELFHRARLVLNVAERGDLNYRVFEALGCGACLLRITSYNVCYTKLLRASSWCSPSASRPSPG